MKKRILSLLLAVVTILQIIPVLTLPTLSEDTASDSVIGSTVRFNTSDKFYLYADVTDSGPSSRTTRAYASDLPETMVVLDTITVSYGTEFYKLGTADGSAHAILDTYPWVKAALVEIVSPPEPEPDDGYVHGKVAIFCDEAEGGVVTLQKGGKVYAFTRPDAEIGDNVRYQWQMRLEDGRWANITDYVLPYAVLSEALLVNNTASSGVATLRCIVTDGATRYASDELGLTAAPAVYTGQTPATHAAVGTPAPQTKAAPAATEEAFQIAVNYVFARLNDGALENAHTPFIVSLGTEETFTGSVDSPFIMGYTACRLLNAGESTDGATEFEGKYYVEMSTVFFDNVGMDDTDRQKVTVYYVPQKTNFIVEHYYQNLKDDGYSLMGTESNKDKYSDDPVGEGLARDVYGFTPLFYDATTTVSGNGNTVIEIYYDRIYYLVDFELDGGYGLMPYYVRYGTAVMLTRPTKPGHSFVDPWTLDRVYVKNADTQKEEDLDPNDTNIAAAYKNKNANESITVEHNLKYVANWKAETASYTIIYWRENADSTDVADKNNYSVWATETKVGATPGVPLDCTDISIPQGLATAEVDGEEEDERPYFTRANALSDQSVVISGDDSTVVNIYYTRNTYHILFSGITGATNVSYNHTHGTDCKRELLCHWHDENCALTLTCSIPEHKTHTSECLVCGKVAHDAHTEACLKGDCVLCTSHTTACYDYGDDIDFNQTTTSIWNGEEINGYIASNWRQRYVYINGTWYAYTGDTNAGNTLSPTCHYQHTDACYTDEIHAHINSCYKDTVHKHTNQCYAYTCPDLDDDHTHTEDCYAPCTLYTNTNNNYSWTISAKYGADISKEWPTAQLIKDNINANYTLRRWSVEGINSTLVSKRVTMTPDLCDTSDNKKTATAESTNSTTIGYLYYMFESFDQTSPASGNNRIQRNGRYYDSDSRYYQEVFGTSSLSQKQISGMSPVSGGTTSNNGRQFLYYNRNRNEIVFKNLGIVVYTLSDVMFEQPLNAAFFNERMAAYTNNKEEWEFVDANGNTVKIFIPIPDTPSTYEEGSVYFAGWYTTPLCVDGTEFNFADNTMPDSEITLFAKWLPTTHTAKVYRQESEINVGQPLLERTVEFGTHIRESELSAYEKPNENYVFAGWYYKDDSGSENRYDFNTMVIKHSYVIYAKWTKNVPIPYSVRYVTLGPDDQKIEIAPADSGIALEGVTKTFTAKSGADLTPPYHEWYFPTQRYITFTMAAHEEQNVAEFVYESADEISYTIAHVFNSEDFASCFPDGRTTFVYETVFTISKDKGDAFQATITESFSDLVTQALITKAARTAGATEPNRVWEIIRGLTPDYFRQVLHLITKSEQNVMTFAWEDAGHTTMYQIIHYTQNKDLSTYSVYHTEGYIVNADSTDVYKADWSDIYGFAPNEGKSTTQGTLPKGDSDTLQGLVLELYYDRVRYTYTVHHYIVNTTKKLMDDDVYDGSSADLPKAYYEENISFAAKAKEISGYVLYNGGDTRTIGTDNMELTCYYSPLKVNFRYQEAIAGRGTLSRTNDYVGQVGEIPDEEASCTATPKQGYVFKGWFADKEATTPIDSSTATLSADGRTVTPCTPTPDMANKTIVFYALFEPTELTITSGISGGADNPPEWVTENQSFIYNIEGADNATSGYSLTVAVPVGESQTILGLPVGDYRITVENTWSWRYVASDGSDTRELTFGGHEDVAFTYEAPDGDNGSDGYYITDNSYNGSSNSSAEPSA